MSANLHPGGRSRVVADMAGRDGQWQERDRTKGRGKVQTNRGTEAGALQCRRQRNSRGSRLIVAEINGRSAARCTAETSQASNPRLVWWFRGQVGSQPLLMKGNQRATLRTRARFALQTTSITVVVSAGCTAELLALSRLSVQRCQKKHPRDV